MSPILDPTYCPDDLRPFLWSKKVGRQFLATSDRLVHKIPRGLKEPAKNRCSALTLASSAEGPGEDINCPKYIPCIPIS